MVDGVGAVRDVVAQVLARRGDDDPLRLFTALGGARRALERVVGRRDVLAAELLRELAGRVVVDAGQALSLAAVAVVGAAAHARASLPSRR